jgi:hypothetical protein
MLDSEEAMKSNKKWFPLIKGGDFRRWYGNQECIVNWENDGLEIKDFKDENGELKSRPQSTSFYFRSGITWTLISSGMPSFRFFEKGFIISHKGSGIFCEQSEKKIFSLLNSNVCSKILEFISPAIGFEIGHIGKIPFVNSVTTDIFTEEGIVKAIGISKRDWDNLETSWDFQTHLLLHHNFLSLSQAFADWQQESDIAFQELKNLEEENNRYWIKAYGLQDELTPEVPDDQITIRRADLSRDIRSLISYAVGCMMGRYSLDQPGLIHAGQSFEPSRHSTFPADADAILPITDQAYFDDDIVSRFIEFIKIAYSPATLTENLDFIANALELKTGETAQDRIRRYFVSEFISDHIKTYKKRPIYWLFTSGKKRAFSALVYLHRYTPDTIGRLRTDYVLELQLKLEKGIEQAQQQTTASSTAAKKQAAKQLKTLQEQQTELRDYQAKLQTVADQRIELDLDDGVAYNYTRFEGIVYEGGDLKMADLKAKAQWKLELLEKALETPHPNPLPQEEEE